MLCAYNRKEGYPNWFQQRLRLQADQSRGGRHFQVWLREERVVDTLYQQQGVARAKNCLAPARRGLWVDPVQMLSHSLFAC